MPPETYVVMENCSAGDESKWNPMLVFLAGDRYSRRIRQYASEHAARLSIGEDIYLNRLFLMPNSQYKIIRILL